MQCKSREMSIIKTHLQESESDASPIKPRQLEKELREVRKECVADLHSGEDYEGNSEADSEQSIDVEEEFPSNRKKRERAQRGRGRGSPKNPRGRGRGRGTVTEKVPAPKRKTGPAPKKQKQPDNYTHWPFLEYHSSPEKKKCAKDCHSETMSTVVRDAKHTSPEEAEHRLNVVVNMRKKAGRPVGSSTKKKKRSSDWEEVLGAEDMEEFVDE